MPPAAVRASASPDLRYALAKGYDDFLTIPSQLIFLGLLYPLVGFVAARAAMGGELLPLAFPLLAGLSLMGPVAATGLYEISRRREAGQPVSLLTAFEAFKSPAISGIVILGFALLILFGLWVAVAQAIYEVTVGPGTPDSMSGFAATVAHSPALIMLGNLAGACFAAVVLAISVVSFPMMLDRLCSPAVAVQTSLRVVARNPVTMALWGLIVAVALVLGAIPALIGLAVAMPILGHATWHLYRRGRLADVSRRTCISRQPARGEPRHSNPSAGN